MAAAAIRTALRALGGVRNPSDPRRCCGHISERADVTTAAAIAKTACAKTRWSLRNYLVRLARGRWPLGHSPILICQSARTATMEVGITTGYRRRVGIAGAGVRTARFVLKNTNSEGSAGSAGMRAAPVRDTPR
jgi:hypothetical protein